MASIAELRKQLQLATDLMAEKGAEIAFLNEATGSKHGGRHWVTCSA